ncbi:MAG: NAD(P)H-dependent oxidoreductase [Pirellulaceae bacterium]|nr:NAD(P)H-dependent oxidoreductase [Pirellulaceae bacterium]
MDTQKLLLQLNWRYAVKKFDPQRQIDLATWQVLEQALVLSPSSYGLQPWRFVVITSPEIKAQLPAISWNQRQPADCSHMVVLTAKEQLDEAYIDQHVQQTADARGVLPAALAGYRRMLLSAIAQSESHLDWNSRQVYLALGQLLTAAAILGVDACPLEGIQLDAYDKLLGLEALGYRSVVGCALGYRDPSDVDATKHKVRFATQQIIQRV